MILFLVFSYVLFFSLNSCSWFSSRNIPNKSHKLIFQLDSSSLKACLFSISKNEPSSKDFCNSELTLKTNSCWTFEFPNSYAKVSKEKFVLSQFLKILSELELNHPQIKNSLGSVLILSYEKEYLKKEKDFQKEFEPILKKYQIPLYLHFLNEEEQAKHTSEFLENDLAFFYISKPTESQFLIKSLQTKKNLLLKEEISPFLISIKNHEKKEFISCRQALSEKIRSTGKTGVENAINCKGLILEEFRKSKAFINIQKEILEKQISNFYLQGWDWNLLKEISNSDIIAYTKLLEHQKDYCYLSPMELIKKYKISKALAKSACYSLSFGISFFDFFNINEAKLIQQEEFLRYMSIHPQFNFECNPNPLPSKKKV